MTEKPYIEHTVTTVERSYNPAYGDDRVCECGHPYYRHFDTYENMAVAGCEFLMWRREHKIWSRSKWLHMACKLLRENDDLRKQLGIKERFGQLNSLEDHIP